MFRATSSRSLLVAIAARRPPQTVFSTVRVRFNSSTSIHARLKQDLKDAMRSKLKLKLNVIKGILSDLTYAEKNPQQAAAAGGNGFSKDLDSDVATIIQKAIKRRQESIESFRQNCRDDLADIEQQEIAILQQYLPKQLTDEQIETAALSVMKRLGVEGGIKAMGQVMKEIDINPAQAPKSRVAEVVKRLLTRQNKDA